MVQAYVASDADPALYDFLQHDFTTLDDAVRWSRVDHVPEFPVFPATLHGSDRDADRSERAGSSASSRRSQPVLYTADDLQMRQFLEQTTRRLTRKGAHQAA